MVEAVLEAGHRLVAITLIHTPQTRHGFRREFADLGNARVAVPRNGLQPTAAMVLAEMCAPMRAASGRGTEPWALNQVSLELVEEANVIFASWNRRTGIEIRESSPLEIFEQVHPDVLAEFPVTLPLRFCNPLVGSGFMRKRLVLAAVTQHVGGLIAGECRLDQDEPARSLLRAIRRRVLDFG